MQQRDYVMREIEKMGAVMRAIFNKLFGRKDDAAGSFEERMTDAKSALLEEMALDIDAFIHLNDEETNSYIARFEGFNIENLELFAQILTRIGFDENAADAGKYLEKALQIYELCNLNDKIYSFEREANMNKIRSALG